MRRLLLLITLGSSIACAQCTLLNQTTCASVYAGSPNPTLATYLANVESSFQAINAATAGMSQPKMLLTAQNDACGYLAGSVQVYGGHMNGYAGLLQSSAGVNVQDCNMWLAALASANEYTHGTINVTSDCNG